MGNCESAPPVQRKPSAKRLCVPEEERKHMRHTGSMRSVRRLDSCESKNGLRSIVSMRRRQAEVETKGSAPSCASEKTTNTDHDTQRERRDGTLWGYTLKQVPPNPWESTTGAYERYLSQYSLACDQPTAEAFERWKEDNNLTEDNMVPASSCSDSEDDDYCCTARFQPPEHPKPGYEHRSIVRCLKKSPLFKKLRDAEFDVFAKAAQKVVFRQGEEIFKHGSIPQASRAGVYCLMEGRVEVNMQGLVSTYLTPGACFGEQSAANQLGRSQATVKALCPVTCYLLGAEVCLQLLGQQEENRRGEYLAIMNGIEYLKDLKRVQLIRLCDLLEEVTYKKGECIIPFGEEATHFHFILKGEVSVVGRETVSDTIVPSVTRHVCDYGVGDPLGHLEMFSDPMVAKMNDPFDAPRSTEVPRNIADVIAKSEVVTARLSRKDFISCMTSATGTLREMVEGSENYSYYRGTTGMRFPDQRKVVLNHPRYRLEEEKRI
eukprot:TRINITY_DN47211_c0_g1_i1.p1 TRINITY_DN47211_c0_g1~~TRINITY_DN47211_c0_g1_i1.p1  ORF type:complete len:498 (+),score=163.81 TRINITY_DN47211_c0_g1_i1:27-1496(+)